MVESDARYAQDFSWKLYMKYEYSLLPRKGLIEELRRPMNQNDQEYFGIESNESPNKSVLGSFAGYNKP
jgi:hypothetical protein